MKALASRSSWLLSLPLLALTFSMLNAQPSSAGAFESLDATVKALDAEVFDGYNTCNLEKFGKYFAEDVEFYHDKGGASHGRAKLLDALKNNICNKVRRELVSTEVFPMDNYGALQTGLHRFHHPGREKEDGVGEAKFIHLWQKRGEDWVITRVISYDHRPVQN